MRRLFRVLLAALLFAAACFSPVSIASAEADEPFTIAWMSDTQICAESYPRIFNSMTKWLSDNKQSWNIKYMFHTGDVINHRFDLQEWKNADSAMRTIYNVIPFGIAAGNHDIGPDGSENQNYISYFGAGKRPNQPSATYYGNGTGQYDVMELGGQDYLLLSMGYVIGDAEIEWMNRALKSYPNHIAILGLHSYMNTDGKRNATGEKVFEQVVKPNANVRLVLCGHMHAVNRRADSIDDNGDGIYDRAVEQLLMDFQAEKEGGQGYMRLLYVEPAKGTLRVYTYSTWLDRYDNSAKSAFTLDWPMQDVSGSPGWRNIAGRWYYFLEDGSKAAGWHEIDGERYAFSISGEMAAGWAKDGSNWYFMQKSGKSAVGWIHDDGWYYMDENGVMQTGWEYVNEKWYYLKPSGKMETGWIKTDSWYYLRQSGEMATGWVRDKGVWYYLKPSGAMAENEWVLDGGTWYWLKSSGAMATGSLRINGRTNRFSSSGAWLG